MSTPFTLTSGGTLLAPREGSLRGSKQLNGRDTMSFTLKSMDGSEPLDEGDEVILEVGAERVFAGTVDSVSETELDAGDQAVRQFAYQCVDFNQVCDRRQVAEVYTNVFAGDIVRDFVARWLAGEGFTATGVQDGPLIEKVVYPYVSVTQALNELSELTGYAWRVDYFRDLRFFSRASNVAPWSITDTSRPYRPGTLNVKRSRAQLRNRQRVRAGKDTTDPRTERFVGDGTRQVFTVAFPMAQEPVIEVDDVAQDVGILGVETGKQWYWNKERTEISQDTAGTPLTPAQTLAVTYRGYFPIIVEAQSDSSIAERQAKEGGSGIYESLVDSPEIDSADLALLKAQGLLRRYGTIDRTVSYETDLPGLEAGQLQNVHLTAKGLSGDFLVDAVEFWDRGDYTLRFRPTLLSGEQFGGWMDFFRRLVNAGRKYVIRDNEVLILLRARTDVVTLDDSLTTTTLVPAVNNRVGTARVGFSQVM